VTSLTSKITSAIGSLDKSNSKSACGQMGSFDNEIHAMMKSGRMSSDIGNYLLGITGQVESQVC